MDEENKELSDEEILEQFKKENKNGDERDRDRLKYAPYAGFLAGGIMILILEIVMMCLHKDYLHLVIVLCTMLSAQSIYQSFVVTKNKRAIRAAAIVTTVCTVGAIICWILTLVLE